MSAVPETFFLQKIGRHLTDRERDMLLTPVTELGHDFTPEEGLLLQAKCFKALSDSYRWDVESPGSTNHRANAVQWREANVRLYQSSNRVISGIVQNWYLSEGRRLEFQGSMRPFRPLLGVFVLLLVGVLLTLLSRC